MNTTEDFTYLIQQLQSKASDEFRSTKEYMLLKEKLEKMDADCEIMFTENDLNFVIECFELLLYVSSQKEEYLYQKGLSDGILILKKLGVLT